MTSEFVNTNEIKFEDLNHDPDMMFAKSLRDQVRKFLIFILYLSSHSIHRMSSCMPQICINLAI